MGDIYLDGPLNREMIHERKMAQLQAEIAAVESRMSQNADLKRRLEHMTDAERDRTQRILDKMNSRNSVLKDEIDRFYQSKSPPLLSPSPTTSPVINDVIARRTKEFSEQQHEKALQYKYLMAEKQRLQVAQERLREKRMAMHRIPTPEDGKHRVPRPPTMESVHSDASYMHRAAMDMPHAVDRIWQLKEELRDDYEKRRKPYRGELGVESYEPWQMEDYVWIRKFVEDFLDDFVDKYTFPDYSYVEGDVRLSMYRSENAEWGRTADGLTERRAVQLVAEEILLQETKHMMRQIAAEVLHVHGTFKNIVDILMMREAESISTQNEAGRDEEDPAYHLVTKSYFTLQQNRNKFKKDLWTHSQYLFLNKVKRADQDIEDEIDDTETEKIDYTRIHPMDLRKYQPSLFDPEPVRRIKERAIRYRNREADFWTHVQPTLAHFDIPYACQGVMCMKPSPEGTYMAIGTVNGDVLMYDVRMEPWRLGRVAFNTLRDNNSTTDVAWSLDGTRIISVHTGGQLQVWDTEGPAISQKDLKTLEIRPDDKGNLPKRLGLIGALDVNLDDFHFHLGPMAESEVLTERVGPVKGAFFPSFSLFGLQHSICASLGNNDIMKVNIEALSATDDMVGEEVTYPEAPRVYQPNIYDESHGVNIVGQNLEGELFRHHQHPVVYLGFIDNISRMVSVDSEGFVSIWKYDPAFISGFGYFIPQKKLKLDFVKTMYTPSSADKPKVIFTDSVKNNAKTPAEIARERTRVQHQLDNMNLGDPWHEELVPDRNLVTSVYAPRGGVKDSGAMFNIVLRHQSTKQLSSYLTRMYKPVKVKATKLLGVVPTPSGRELVFILLFPEFPPKEAHMMVLVFDLMTLKLRDYRRDIHLPTKEHDKLASRPIISFATSRVFAPTGAEYLFVLMEGRIRGISLTTGNLVIRAEDPRKPSGFIGCVVDEQRFNVAKTAQATCVCFNGAIYVALYDKRMTGVDVLQLRDINGYEGRRLMWKAYQISENFHRAPPETRVDMKTWLLSDMEHAEVEMRRLILELVDENIFGIRPGEDEEGDTQRAIEDKIEQYEALHEKVEEEGLLDEGPTHKHDTK